MSHSHAIPATNPDTRAGARHLKPLAITFGLVVAFMVVEAVAGWLTNSLALLSDAGHMLTDAVGLGMALAAITAGNRIASGGHHTYGLYRLEILAALANALLLVAVAGYVFVEAITRLDDPPEVLSGPMLVVAVVGLVVNIIGFALLHDGASESINIEGALLEVVADLFGSIGAISAALIMLTTGWAYADPILGAAVGVFILPRAWSLGRQALRVLLQAAPPHLDINELRTELEAIEGVVDVHDLHVWTLTSEMEVASLHLMTREETDAHDVLDQARVILRDRHHIGHATMQVEPESHEHCSEVSW